MFGRPAWEHEGFEEAGVSNPFIDQDAKVAPWTGLMAEVRQKYLQGVRITVHGTDGEGRVIVYSKE